MSHKRFSDKDPNDRLDYTVDFVEKFESAETIAAAVWSHSPSGGATPLVKESQSETGAEATVTYSGGVLGVTYTITLKVTTNKGLPARIFERDFKLKVRNR